jgi:hypothetical protein
MNIKRLMEIGSYRGLRHRRGLPVGAAHEDQRAHTQGPAPWRSGREEKVSGKDIADRSSDGSVQEKSREEKREERSFPVASPTFRRPSTTPL